MAIRSATAISTLSLLCLVGCASERKIQATAVESSDPPTAESGEETLRRNPKGWFVYYRQDDGGLVFSLRLARNLPDTEDQRTDPRWRLRTIDELKLALAELARGEHVVLFPVLGKSCPPCPAPIIAQINQHGRERDLSSQDWMDR